MDTIIEEVQELLAKNIKEIRYISEDWGQLETEQPQIVFPCALVDIDDVQFDDIVRERQKTNVTLSVTIANIPTKNVSYLAPEALKKQYKTKNTLSEHDSQLHSRMICSRIRRRKREDNIQEYTVTFGFWLFSDFKDR